VTISDEPLVKEPADFSLVLGGPLYQLWRGTRLADDTLHLLHRRVLVTVLVAWVPLLLLSIAEGHAWGNRITLPLLYDVELHVRLRNSITAEVLLIAFVYVVGVGFIWRTQFALNVASWYGASTNGKWQPSLAGWWLGLVSLPLCRTMRGGFAYDGRPDVPLQVMIGAKSRRAGR